MAAARLNILVIVLSLSLTLALFPETTNAQLRTNFYSATCPNVEQIVKTAVLKKIQQTFVTVPATLRLFFHDCFVNGCDASVMIQSPNNNAEKDNPDNQSLAGDGFDTVVKAKQAVDAIPRCKNKVSCADILALATRDVIVAVGGPSYSVELGRRDGLVSTSASVNGNLPHPTDDVSTLNKLFIRKGLTQADMIALSAAHTVGFSHCAKFTKRIYNFNRTHPVDPTINKAYVTQLKAACPKNVDPRIAINMDPNTPRRFDNVYYKNLQQGKGLFTSDQQLFQDGRTRPLVNDWAKDAGHFNSAFITAMTKLGRVGVKTGNSGNIRKDCSVFN